MHERRASRGVSFCLGRKKLLLCLWACAALVLQPVCKGSITGELLKKMAEVLCRPESQSAGYVVDAFIGMQQLPAGNLYAFFLYEFSAAVACFVTEQGL